MCLICLFIHFYTSVFRRRDEESLLLSDGVGGSNSAQTTICINVADQQSDAVEFCRVQTHNR